jgi:hypothetical protein
VSLRITWSFVTQFGRSGSKDRAASIAKWQIHQLAKFVPAARDLVIHAPKAA